MGEEYEEFGEPIGKGSYRGVSSGAGADLGRALQQAARAAADDGQAGSTFSVGFEVVPQDHNQWVKTYTVIISGGG